MKTQGVINPLGEIITHDVTFEPNVNIYDRTLQDGIERVIRIECPGVQEEDIKWKASTCEHLRNIEMLVASTGGKVGSN